MTFSVMLAVLAVALAPAPAVAQERLWGSDSRPEDIQRMHDFSYCLAQRRGDEARALLALDYRTDAYRAATRKLALRHHGCAPVTGRLGFNGVVFAGGLAEALIGPLGSAAAFAARVTPRAGAEPIEARDDTEYMGLCLVKTAPAEVFAVLNAKPASDDERAAVGLLAPRFSGCLPQGASLRMNRIFTRALLALAAYRLGNHAATALPASGAE